MPTELVTAFRVNVIRPVLADMATVTGLPLNSQGAEELLTGVACHESDGLLYVRQLGDGPALGPYQMEPATHDDLFRNFLAFRPWLKQAVLNFSAYSETFYGELAFNAFYATACARAQFYRFSDLIPEVGDLLSQANLWKLRWNSMVGRGTVAEYIDHWNEYAS